MSEHRKQCPTCRQFLPYPRPKGLVLSPRQNAVFDRIKRAGDNGIDTERLLETVYADCENGGPLSGIKIIHVMVCNINKKLRKTGFEIKCLPRGAVDRVNGGRMGSGDYVLRKLT